MTELFPNQVCHKCAFRFVMHGAKVCKSCWGELLKDARRAVGRLVHLQDQISARIDEEGGEPTEEEWAALREVVGFDEEEEQDGQEGII